MRGVFLVIIFFVWGFLLVILFKWGGYVWQLILLLIGENEKTHPPVNLTDLKNLDFEKRGGFAQKIPRHASPKRKKKCENKGSKGLK